MSKRVGAKISKSDLYDSEDVLLVSTAGISMHDNSIIFLCKTVQEPSQYYHRNEKDIIEVYESARKGE